MKSRLLLIVLFVSIAAMAFAQAADLFLSEYVEGTSNNKAIEIFNGTGSSVDLSNYKIWKISNGGTWAEGDSNGVVLTGSLANNDCYVICNGQASAEIQQVSDMVEEGSTVTWYNGDDAVGLAKLIGGTWTLIDCIGTDGPDVGTAWPVAGVADATLNHTLIRKATINGGNTDWEESAGTDAGNSEWNVQAIDYITDLGVHTYAGDTPMIVVSSPNGGESWAKGTAQTIIWSSANFTGNVKIELLNNGTPAVLAATVTNNGSWTWNIPETQALGAAYKVRISDAADGNPVDESNSTFSIVGINAIANLAALRAATADNATIYTITGNVTVTYSQTFRHQKFVQDGTAGILVDDNSGIIATTYNEGDVIHNLTGKLYLYGTVLEFIPTSDPGAPVATGNIIIPQEISLSEFVNNYNNYDAEIIRIEDVTIDSTGTFANGKRYPIHDDSANGRYLRTSFYDMNYIGTEIPAEAITITGICNNRADGIYFTPRHNDDLYSLAVEEGIQTPNKTAMKSIYPNPFNPSTTLAYTLDKSQNIEISVYNLKGQKVTNLYNAAQTAGNHTVTWNGNDSKGNVVSSGMYFFKLTTSNGSLVKKAALLK